MPCRPLPGGGFICGRVQRQRCETCGAPSTILCDYPVTTHKSGTCDQHCCRRHAENIEPDKDYCLAHANFVRKQQGKEPL